MSRHIGNNPSFLIYGSLYLLRTILQAIAVCSGVSTLYRLIPCRKYPAFSALTQKCAVIDIQAAVNYTEKHALSGKSKYTLLLNVYCPYSFQRTYIIHRSIYFWKQGILQS